MNEAIMARRRANSAKIDPALFHRSASSVTLTEDVITAYLSILRAEGLAERLNVTRQTISAFEGGQREMPWNVFLASLMLFSSRATTNKMLVALGIYTEQIKYFLTGEWEELRSW